MRQDSLASAVAGFSGRVRRMSDTDLDRDWAWGAYDSEGIRFACFRTFEELRDLAVRLLATRAGAGAPVTAAQRIVARYHVAFRELDALLDGIPPESHDEQPADDAWSVREAVAHLVEAEAGFYVVTTYAVDRARRPDDRPTSVPDATWAALLGPQPELRATLDGPFDGLRAFHRTLNAKIRRDLGGVTDDELGAESWSWEGYPMDVRFRLGRFESHLRQHTIQIEKALDANGWGLSEVDLLVRMVHSAWADVEGTCIGYEGADPGLVDDVAGRIATRADEIAAIVA